MNKKEFLSKLKKRLSILNESEQEDILEEYEGHINEKIASGKTEKEAIKDFGDFDELIKEILSAYKIKENYAEVKKEKNVITDFIESVVNFVKDFIDNISKRSKDDIIKIIFEFIVLLMFISILKIPVLFIEELGQWLFEKLINPFGDGLAFIWKYMIEVIYLILTIVAIINFAKKRYLNVNEDIKLSLNKEEKKKEKVIKENRTLDKKIKNENKTKLRSYIVSIIILCIKIGLILITIPAIFIFVFMVSIVIFSLILLISGVPYFGIFLCILTFALLNYIFINLSFRFILNKKINSKMIIGSIVTSVIIFCVGFGLSIYEVINTTYIDGVPNIYKEYEKIVKEKEEVYTTDTKLTCNSLHHTSCKYNIDDTMKDNIKATVSYYKFNKDFIITDELEYKRVENPEYSLKEIYNLVIKYLKLRKIYNYNELAEIDVEITVSNATMQKIRENQKCYYCN